MVAATKKGPATAKSAVPYAKAITNPTAGDVHVNRPLTNFAQKFLQNANNFIAMRAFPQISVAKQGDLYYEFDRDDFFRDDAQERADGTESAGSGYALSTNPYFARVYAYHKDVSDRQRANADEAVGPDRSATQFVAHKHLIRRERDFVTTFISPSVWTTDVTPGTLWDAASSTPIEDIRTGQRTVQESTGFRPNKMIMGRDVWDALLDNDDLLSRINGGATTQLPAMVMREIVAQILELEEILVMDSIFTSSVSGDATPTRSFIGSNDALLYFAPATAGLEDVTAGATFNWTGLMGNTGNGFRIKRFRMENLEADRIEGQMAFDHLVIGADLGYFFENVVT